MPWCVKNSSSEVAENICVMLLSTSTYRTQPRHNSLDDHVAYYKQHDSDICHARAVIRGKGDWKGEEVMSHSFGFGPSSEDERDDDDGLCVMATQ